VINGKRVITVLPVLNEEDKILHIVAKAPRDLVDEMLVVDDASTDDTANEARKGGATVLTNKQRAGCGASIRIGIDYALAHGYDIIAVMAGNGKDDARDLPALLAGLEKGYDFVQGSRYLKGGVWQNMPLHRVVGTKAYSFLFSILNTLWITDATNGFRAYRASLFDDKRIDIWQEWLANYEVESYLFSKSIRLGYRVGEVPVSKIYPPSLALGYTKMKPFVDWWRHFRPSLLLAMRLKS
jgi:dolichol-phosphate mannosyltransferase